MWIWDAYTGAAVHMLTGHIRMIRCLTFSPDGGQPTGGCKGKTVRICHTCVRIRGRLNHSDWVASVPYREQQRVFLLVVKYLGGVFLPSEPVPLASPPSIRDSSVSFSPFLLFAVDKTNWTILSADITFCLSHFGFQSHECRMAYGDTRALSQSLIAHISCKALIQTTCISGIAFHN